MESLTLSTPFTNLSQPSLRNPPPKSLFVHQHPKIPKPRPPIKCSLTSVAAEITACVPTTSRRGAESDVMGVMLRDRAVFIGGEITDFVADSIVSQLLLLDAKDSKEDIRLYINSSGGSLSATMAIFDAVQLVKSDVSTFAIGTTASTASIILGGGTKGKRYAFPNTRIMIHQPLGSLSGEALDVEIQAKELMANKNNVVRIISEFTGRTPEQVEKHIERDRFMSPIEAVEYGMIDRVIDGNSIISLDPISEKIKSLDFIQVEVDPRKYYKPEITDDEI